ncbi:HesA/MoeB/ThiF family protein [Pelotomaculum propionicicum]|uniref:Putative adenylyltransferase/sulfurtransferase MoeZ n=1 Tax=Pelotomaculum propionicicum TaxID=258475 RepID=A0A4Y7RSK5_9FIRM|nr:molybdopterin-synthase adenylyltransferase MoeB [Pelotomaculum propionicicum]NLI14093.1 molybdopterin-synthase adenylyltransferase MoeB [Peptococcaceae bacterium]TEB11652.1 putative adenylyltransferase/sulfurtransferase MoeZ [Pelotomaculum propionicicum]
MSLNDDQIVRYSRHIILPEVGPGGQKKINNGRALLIGGGGLGSPVAYYLAAAGVGTIGIIDDDVVDLSNLQRQILYFTADVGKSKAVSAKERLTALNPDCQVVAYQERLTASNIMRIIGDYDVVVDGTDNFATRFLANDACVITKKPFFHGAVLRFFGQALTVLPGKGPCYRCAFQIPPPPSIVQTCAQTGILGVLPGTIGLIQATEVLKYFLEIGDLLVGKLLTYNALAMEFSKTEIRKNPDCPACGINPALLKLVDYEQQVCDLKTR